MTKIDSNLKIELTGRGVLTDFSNELYNGTIITFQPLISGKEIFRKMRRANILRFVNFITNIPPKSQEKLIDTFTDIVSAEDYTEEISKLGKTLINAIKDEDIKTRLEFADKYFKNLTQSDKNQIYHIAIIRALGTISILRNAINYRMWEKKSNIKELMIVDQVLYKIEEIFNKNLHNMKYIMRDFNYCTYLMLRLEAFKRKKINLEKLENTLSTEFFEYKLPNANIIKPSDYSTVIEVLGA